jgi:S1-C subfamily serine protease
MVVDEVRAHGRVRRAFLGISAEEVMLPAALVARHGLASARAVAVRALESGSPAELAGLAPGDILVRIAGVRLETVSDLQRFLVGDVVGRRIELELLRASAWRSLRVEPVELSVRP